MHPTYVARATERIKRSWPFVWAFECRYSNASCWNGLHLSVVSQELAALAACGANGGSMSICGGQQHGQLVGMMELACGVPILLERLPLGRADSDRAAIS